MANLLFRCWNWCKRFPHRRGYGVHSPTDFFFITSVIYEHLPFYAYASLRKKIKDENISPYYREKINRLLLRITNYKQPRNIIEIGTKDGIHTLFLHAGKPSTQIFTFDSNISKHTENSLLPYPNIVYQNIDRLSSVMKKLEYIDCIHITDISDYNKWLELLLPYIDKQTYIIISKPHENKIKTQWWKELIKDERTRISFDLYELGIIFCDTKRVKKNYIVNFF